MPGPQQQGARLADGHDRDHGVLPVAPADPVAVPGDAVPPVAVVAEPGRDERLPELARVVRAERLPGPGQDGVGQRPVLPVVREQARYGDHPLVHLPLLGLPGHLRHQLFEQLVGAGQPPRQHVDPRAVAEHGAPDGRQRVQADLVGLVEEGALKVDRHGLSLRP